MLTRFMMVLLLGAGLVTCRGPEAAAPLTDDQFVDVVVALRQAAESARGDAAAYVTERDRILAAQNVTAEELQAYVSVRSRDLAHFARVWEAVNTRLAEVDVH